MIKNDIDRPLYTDIDTPLYSIEDDESPLYSLEDEPDKANDDRKPDNEGDDDDPYSEDENEDAVDEDEEEESTAQPVPKRPRPVGSMLRTMFTPVEGWKFLKRARFSTDEFASRCFYPLIALAAISEIANVFYEANFTLADWAVEGLGTFMTFFFGYFTVILLGGIILPRQSRDILRKDIGRQFVMLAMSTLALFWIFINIMPMFEPVLVFLPLWTIYLVYKGVRILRVPKDAENSTTGLLCMLIIGAPLLWDWLLEYVLHAKL